MPPRVGYSLINASQGVYMPLSIPQGVYMPLSVPQGGTDTSHTPGWYRHLSYPRVCNPLPFDTSGCVNLSPLKPPGVYNLLPLIPPGVYNLLPLSRFTVGQGTLCGGLMGRMALFLLSGS